MGDFCEQLFGIEKNPVNSWQLIGGNDDYGQKEPFFPSRLVKWDTIMSNNSILGDGLNGCLKRVAIEGFTIVFYVWNVFLLEGVLDGVKRV